MLQLSIKPFETDEFGFKKAEWKHLNFVLAIHVSGNPNQVIYSFLSKTKINPDLFQNLIEKLNTKPPQTLEECIFIATYFTEIAENQSILNEITKCINHENKILNYILKDSFGKILYNYQLENLYKFAVLNDNNGATQFRKAINKKDNYEIEKSKSIIFDSKQSIFEVVQTQLPFGYCYYPNYLGGKILFNEELNPNPYNYFDFR